MANTKEIQRRIKSIKSTQKITRAMEMVAATKMRKAEEAVLKTRTYANLSWTTVLNLSQAVNCDHQQHPLFAQPRRLKNVAIVLFTSNRGLCGNFNNAIINKAHNSILKNQSNKDKEKINHEFIVVGKKGLSVYSRYGYKVAADFPKSDICYSSTEVRGITRLIIDDFTSGKYDKVMVAFTDHVNAIKQIPRVKQLLPVDLEAQEHHLGLTGQDSRIGVDKDYIKSKEEKYLREGKNIYTFTYEPSAYQVLEEMLPRLLEIQLFQALLESNAAEHSARMAAMRQANESAGELVDDLTLHYNKVRQDAITKEIAEISAGAAALGG